MNSIVVGAYWGDEGKGKIVDLLAKDADWIVRYNGGDNAGHTIVIKEKKVVLHILPSGVLQGKNVAIGPDVFFNPASFLKDIKEVEKAGFKIKGKIVIDERAHVIMPYHIMLDKKREEKNGIGTTKRGIGPVAQDRVIRTTNITVGDMLREDFSDIVKRVLESKQDELIEREIIKSSFELPRYHKKIVQVYSDYGKRIKQYVDSSVYVLHNELRKNKSILMEAAQGTLLDVVHGSRPHVTSSSTIAGGAAANMGIDVASFTKYGIVKAYPTRVGEGPFPTELGEYEDVKKESPKNLTFKERREVLDGNKELLGRWIRYDGAEYGATTGRARRVGYPDFVALKYAALINGIDAWIITKLDVLGGKTFKGAIAYKKNEKISTRFPARLEEWSGVYPVKEYFWPRMVEKDVKAAIKEGYTLLPAGMRAYIKDLVVNTGVPVAMISLGPERNETVTKDVLEETRKYLQ